ncbi:PREDICTED: endoribonuclease Dicer-like [Acropora digitifera]|uniref:endoribonuclease Dicer-like n=1 Tax=Acropora digitifera TaxID=70779 RepID=UPI00077A0FA2|nr:PREDICTED: endoribonuclease Dicer-like [Acropora digitifera]
MELEENEGISSASTSSGHSRSEPESNMIARPRPYQVELFELAKERNTIICLGTGTGKTFISVMLIKEMAYQVRESYKNGGKRTFFLVNTVPLASQQAKVIEKHTDLKVEKYIGAMNVDLWDKEKWEDELNKSNVLVMTAQIFLDLLNHAYIKLSQVNLLIFDECHHAKKEHPYRQITQAFKEYPKNDLPKIMGLTASVVNGKVKPWSLHSEIKELERTLRATCETSQDEEVDEFAARPKENVVVFSQHEIQDDLVVLISILQDVLDQGRDFLIDCRVARSGPLSDAHWYAKAVLRECKETLLELGPWAANNVAESLIRDLGRACHTYNVYGTEGRLFCEFSATQLRQLQSVYRNYLSNSGGDLEDSGQSYIMPKLQKLLMVLREYRPSNRNETEQDNKLCGIVFVERRYTAKILSEQINIAAQLDHELSFVQSDFVIGHGTGGRVNFSAETEMNFKKQENVLRQFRQHKFNLLIATCVVEEGLDIPKCNLVCRFDFPKTFRSYVQSKGRARARDSCYCLLVDSEEKMEKTCELENMQQIENVLSEMCRDRDEPTEEECDEAADTHFLPPFQPPNGEGARLTMSSSISLLSRYCSKLPADRFTALKPVYKIQELGKDAYACKLEMPTTCPLRTTIIGCPMPRKNLSKMAAAYQACKKLYEMGELAENLLPVLSESDDESETEEEVEPGSDEKKKAKAGTKKRKRVYDRKVFLVRSFKLYPNYGEVTVSLCSSTALRVFAPSSMENQETARKFHCFLFSHILREEVEIKPKNPDGEADGYFVVLVKKSGRDVDYGAMKEAMGLVNPRYTRSVEEDMVVTRNDQDFQQSKLQRIAVLRVRHDLSPLSPFPYSSNSRQRYKSYWEYFGERLKIKDQPLIEVKHVSNRVNFLVDRKRESIRKGLELFPELCNVCTIRASLLSVSLLLPSILHRVNALYLVGDVKRMVAGVRHKTDESGLPSIGAKDAIDEISLLRADEKNTDEEMQVDDDDSSARDGDFYEEGLEDGELINDDDDDSEEFPGLFSDLKSLFSSSRGPPDHPDTALVLQALTTTHSVDAFHLERLEMLGDAFLKLAVSLHLFWNYQDKDEGKLTVRKVRQISNKALYHAAVKTKLAGYQQCTQLARDNWCPTGSQFRKPPPETTPSSGDAVKGMDIDSPTTVDAEMEVEGAVGEDSQSVCESAAKPDIQVIADKSIADSMEALIGAYLISCGYVGALRFLKFLGLKVLPDDADRRTIETSLAKSEAGCYAKFWEQPESNMTGAGDNAAMAARLESGLENFEDNSIGYRFRSKLYLVEALTHASYHPNRITPCYQRLEFLGDAVLDFLVTQHLYFRHGKLSPGDLTDIRQALVNNNIFAVIAVKKDFNKYLKEMSPTLFKIIENFITFVDDENEERKQNYSNEVSADPFVIVSEENAEGIDTPKVLGDIFESVAGAVFLDSGMDLTKIWGVYYRMMKPYIDHYSVNIPMNPIREIHEKSHKVECSKPEELPNGKIQCTLQVDWGEFVGKGSNSRIAKATAAKLALQARERQQASQKNE